MVHVYEKIIDSHFSNLQSVIHIDPFTHVTEEITAPGEYRGKYPCNTSKNNNIVFCLIGNTV